MHILRENRKEFIKNNKLVLRSQQRLGSEKHNVFNEEINKIALNARNNKRIQSIDSTETYAYARSKGLVCNKEKIKCNNLIKQYKNDYLQRKKA